MKTSKTRLLPLAEALLVTFLWSTSYILIKTGLEGINPWAFAAYRYSIASIILVAATLYKHKELVTNLNLNCLLIFILLGFTGYFIAQGLQFLGLYYLQPITVTLILNLTPIFVLAFSVLFLDEKPSFPQLLGIGLSLCGVFTFFYSSLQVLEEVTGLVVTLFSGIGWAAYMVLSRCLLRDSEENVMVMTSYSMVLRCADAFSYSRSVGKHRIRIVHRLEHHRMAQYSKHCGRLCFVEPLVEISKGV